MTRSLRLVRCPLFALAAALAIHAPATEGQRVDRVEVALDFTATGLQLDGADGASACQFHGVKPDGSAAAANVAYSTLGGFPDDSPATDFGKFCDTAFATNGMALSQLWVTPCPLQTPPGSVGDHFSAAAWPRLDFSMYEPNVLATNRFYNSHGRDAEPIRGHTVAMLQASLHRVRAAGTRACYWTDVHTDFPPWMWKDGQRRNPVREEMFEEAALHSVYFVKWLTAKYGIPIYAVSFVNEPDMPNRHGFKPPQLLRAARILRERLDEAGLHGVRIMPCTAISMNHVRLDWAKSEADTLNELTAMLEGSHREFAPCVDLLAGHGSQSETPIAHLPANTRFWRASGDFNEHWTNSVGFDMGPAEMIDDVIRHNTWLYGRGVAQCGIWQIASRIGIGGDFFRMPETFDPARFGRPEAINGAAVVYPYLRPGMFVIGGSQGHSARESYSVDGFGGRGQREVVVITNSREPRTFAVRFRNSRTQEVQVHQASVSDGKRTLGALRLEHETATISVPADSVTTLVGAASTRHRAYLIVPDRARLSARDRTRMHQLTALKFEAVPVSQELSSAEQDAFHAKRHPVDAFGAALFVISDSVDRLETASAYRTAMAPVIAIGDRSAAIMGLSPGAWIDAGAPLSFRNELDPPSEMLDGGLPRACGPRLALPAGVVSVDLGRSIQRFLNPGPQ